MSKKDFENMSQKEIEDYFGVTQEQIEEWDDMLVRGGDPGCVGRRSRCRAPPQVWGAFEARGL